MTDPYGGGASVPATPTTVTVVRAPGPTPADSGGELPFTGFDVVGFVVIALVLVAAGLSLRHRRKDAA